MCGMDGCYMEISKDVFRISKDIERSKSLIAMAKERVNEVIPLYPKEIAYKILEEYYEVAVQLMTSIMYADGFKTLSHIKLIEYVGNCEGIGESEVKILDSMRKFRHGTFYYGKKESGNFFLNHEEEIKEIIEKLMKIAEGKGC